MAHRDKRQRTGSNLIPLGGGDGASNPYHDPSGMDPPSSIPPGFAFPPTIEALSSFQDRVEDALPVYQSMPVGASGPDSKDEEIQAAARRAAEALAARSAPPLGAEVEEWERHETEEGKVYYYHRPTKRREWTVPDSPMVRVIEPKRKRRKTDRNGTMKHASYVQAPMFDETTGDAARSGAGSHLSFPGIEHAPAPGTVGMSGFVSGGELKADLPGRTTEAPRAVGMTLEELRARMAAGQLSDSDDENVDEPEEEEDFGKFNPWGDDDFDLDAMLDEVEVPGAMPSEGDKNVALSGPAILKLGGSSETKEKSEPSKIVSSELPKAPTTEVKTESIPKIVDVAAVPTKSDKDLPPVKQDPDERILMDLMMKLKLPNTISFRAAQPRLLYEKKYKEIPKERREILFDKVRALLTEDASVALNARHGAISKALAELKTKLLTEERGKLLRGVTRQSLEDQYSAIFAHASGPDARYFESVYADVLAPVLSTFSAFKSRLDRSRIHELKMLLITMIRDYSAMSDETNFRRKYQIKLVPEGYPECLYQDLEKDEKPEIAPMLIDGTSFPEGDIPKPHPCLHTPVWDDFRRILKDDPRYRYLPSSCDAKKIFDDLLEREFMKPRDVARREQGYELVSSDSPRRGPRVQVSPQDRTLLSSVLEQVLPANPFKVSEDDLMEYLEHHKAYTNNKAAQLVDLNVKKAVFRSFLHDHVKKQVALARSMMDQGQDCLAKLFLERSGRLGLSELLDTIEEESKGSVTIGSYRDWQRVLEPVYEDWRIKLLAEWDRLCLEFLRSSPSLDPTILPTSAGDDWEFMIAQLNKDLRFSRIKQIDHRHAMELVRTAQETSMKAKSQAKSSRYDQEAQDALDGNRLSDFNKGAGQGFELAEDDD